MYCPKWFAILMVLLTATNVPGQCFAADKRLVQQDSPIVGGFVPLNEDDTHVDRDDPTPSPDAAEEPSEPIAQGEEALQAHLAENAADDDETADSEIPVPEIEESEIDRLHLFQGEDDGAGILNQEYLAAKGAYEAHETTKKIALQLKAASADRNVDPSDLAVVLVHKGESMPNEIRSMARSLKLAGFQVKVYRHRNGKPRDGKPKYTAINQEEMRSQLLLRLQHDSKTNPELKKLFDANGELKPGLKGWMGGYVRRFTSRVRQFFGVEGGVSWAMYSDPTTGYRRPVGEQWKDVSWNGLALGSVVFGLGYMAALEKAAGNPELYPLLGAVTAACFTVFWSYFERANGAYQAQGKFYNPVSKKLETNNPWFYLSTLMHSLPTSLITQLAFYSVFGISWGDIGHAASNSALGVVGKKPLRLWIVRHMKMGQESLHDTAGKRHSALKTRLYFLAFNAGMQFLKLGHLFKLQIPYVEDYVSNEFVAGMLRDSVSMTFIALAIAGGIYEVKRHFEGANKPRGLLEAWSKIKKRLEKDWKQVMNFFRIRPLAQCDTQVLIRLLTPDERDALQRGKPGEAGLL